MQHIQSCRQLEHSDAARRISDTYTLHRLADPIGNIGRWFAVALANGMSDNVIYDTRSECVRHQHHNELFYAYIQIIPGNMTICDAEMFLKTNRKLHDAGIKLTDRDHRSGGRVVIPRVSREDQMAQMRAILHGSAPKNLILPGGN